MCLFGVVCLLAGASCLFVFSCVSVCWLFVCLFNCVVCSLRWFVCRLVECLRVRLLSVFVLLVVRFVGWLFDWLVVRCLCLWCLMDGWLLACVIVVFIGCVVCLLVSWLIGLWLCLL